jgi:hypothetical protein
MGSGMRPVKSGDALRVGKLEGIDGLVLVPDHNEVPCFSGEVQENLLRPVEVLVLVDQYVFEHTSMGRSRIVSQIAQCFRDQFTDEHGFLESKPADKLPVKCLIDEINRPAWHLGLKTRPCGIECLKAVVSLADSTEAIPTQVLEQEPLLEM